MSQGRPDRIFLFKESDSALGIWPRGARRWQQANAIALQVFRSDIEHIEQGQGFEPPYRVRAEQAGRSFLAAEIDLRVGGGSIHVQGRIRRAGGSIGDNVGAVMADEAPEIPEDDGAVSFALHEIYRRLADLDEPDPDDEDDAERVMLHDLDHEVRLDFVAPDLDAVLDRVGLAEDELAALCADFELREGLAMNRYRHRILSGRTPSNRQVLTPLWCLADHPRQPTARDLILGTLALLRRHRPLAGGVIDLVADAIRQGGANDDLISLRDGYFEEWKSRHLPGATSKLPWRHHTPSHEIGRHVRFILGDLIKARMALVAPVGGSCVIAGIPHDDLQPVGAARLHLALDALAALIAMQDAGVPSRGATADEMAMAAWLAGYDPDRRRP